MKKKFLVTFSIIFIFIFPLRVLAAGRASEVDVCAARTTASTLNQLVSALKRCGKSELQRARAAFTWLAKNIDYDSKSLVTGEYVYKDYSARSVFQTRIGTCIGYSNLFNALAAGMGLESKRILGFTRKAKRGVPDHVWNAVRVDGSWKLLDATFGAGTVDGPVFRKRFQPEYFASDPEFFRLSHLPTEPQWQLLPPISREQFFKSGNFVF